MDKIATGAVAIGNDPGRRPPSVGGYIHVEGSAVGAALVSGHGNVVSIIYNTYYLHGRPPGGAKLAAGEPALEAVHQVRIFLSSPGDVAYERQLVREVARELVAEPFLRDRAMLTIVAWDDPAAPAPMLADRTPQESVSRRLPKPSECDIVVLILWSRLSTPLPDEYRKPDGEPYLSGTEYEYEDALRSDPRPDILIYRRTEEPRISLGNPDDPKIQEVLDQRRRANRFFASFRNPDGSLRGGVTEYDIPSAFADRLKKDLRELVAARLKEPFRALSVDTGIPPNAMVVQPWTSSPYPGLRPFTSEETAIFFGRGREVDAVVARLCDPAQRFLAVVGASGCGKSSLVRAGLLPRLADSAVAGSRHWPVLAFTPGAAGGDPFLALASELKGMLPATEQKPQIEIAKALAATPQRFGEYADMLLADRPAGAALVLFADQLEELFTLAAEKDRGAFAELLARAAGDPRVCVLATLRADFLPQGMSDPVLAPLLQAGTFPLGPPGPAALADMIRRPAARAGLDLEDGLADEILKEAGGDPGALPLIAFCLEELYRQPASKHCLTLDAYQALGGLRGAIGRRTDAILEEFREAQAANLEAVLPQVFHALVHVDAAGKAARLRAFRAELMSAPSPIPQFVGKLINGRLLLGADASGQAIVTLAHEALLQEWPALRQWLKHNRARMQHIQSLLLLIKADKPGDRKYAVTALTELEEIGPASAEAVPALIAALYDPNGDVRRAAADALGRLGPAAAKAVPALIAALHDPNEDVRRAAAALDVRRAATAALERIGPAPTEAVPALVAALQNTNWDIRRAAANALGQIGPAAAEAAPALITALNDTHWDVRRAATAALEQIGPASTDVDEITSEAKK